MTLMALQLYLFGTPQCSMREGRPITIQRRKAIALLAYLAVTAQPHNRDALATLFWPDHDQSGARANLRRDLSYLKQGLGDAVLAISRAEVLVNPEAVLEVDTAVFNAHLAQVQAHAHRPGQLCRDCQGALVEAVACYGGDFMAGFTLPDCPEFDDWQFFQREGLRQALATALQQLIAWNVTQGTYGDAIEYGRQWVALDSLHEAAHCRLMQLYAWDGQQSAALRQYEECRRLLDEELGVPPAAETVALYEAIKSRQLLPPDTADAAPSTDKFADPRLRYRREELLAVGGHGELYRGFDQVSDAPVVVKQLRQEVVRQAPESVARFQREGEALRRLDHPNIVKMLDTFEADGQTCIVMEYVPGGSLRSLLDEEGHLPAGQVVALGLELADALGRAHHLGIIHRDLKPENVLLADDGTPRLADFGVALLEGDDVRLTQAGAVLGSPAYVSPEAMRGEELDTRSDVWSLGVILYEMITGERPFKGEQTTAVMVSILAEEAPEIGRAYPDVPPRLATLLQRMLDKEPANRPASARLVAAELEAIQAGTGEVSLLTAGDTPGAAHNLPTDLIPFLGREAELAQIHQMLSDPGCRLLTITGLGGMGKSRLALQAARERCEDESLLRQGVFYVPLTGLTAADTLAYALAEALGLSFYTSRDDPVSVLINYLKPRATLILLDNLEHLLDEENAARVTLVVGRLLQGCPGLKFLVTSREPLQLEAEWRLNLDGLPYPPKDGGDGHDYAAISLFVQSARQVQSDFVLGPGDEAVVRHLCRLVSGMPLALKLAATWLKVMSPEQIVAETERGLDLLVTRFRDVPERQRSMRAIFDQTWQLLPEPEQRLFSALSLFRAAYSADAAREVAGASPF